MTIKIYLMIWNMHILGSEKTLSNTCKLTARLLRSSTIASPATWTSSYFPMIDDRPTLFFLPLAPCPVVFSILTVSLRLLRRPEVLYWVHFRAVYKTASIKVIHVMVNRIRKCFSTFLLPWIPVLPSSSPPWKSALIPDQERQLRRFYYLIGGID